MKLGPKDKFILLFIALIAVTFTTSKFIIKPLETRIEGLMAEKTETLGLKTDISPLIEKSKKLKNQEELLRENVENIILSFEKQFTDFSNKIYEEAIGE